MSRLGKLGTHVIFTGGDYEGEIATVVLNGLSGVGVKIGKHYPEPKDFEGTTGGLFANEVPDDWPWNYDVMLREPYEGCADYCCNEWEFLEDYETEKETQ